MAATFKDYKKKKTTLYKERDEVKRTEFQKKLEQIAPDTLVYIDEAGLDNRLYREYGRAPRGQKVYANIPGKKRERISIIGALRAKQFIAPFTFQGGCNSDVFNALLEQVLLPTLPKGTTIIMDNAAFHKSEKTESLIQQYGCHLLFLPTYSPDLNPIEHYWFALKNHARKILRDEAVSLRQAVKAAIEYMNLF